jgi:uncharacterized protein with HEPN domain
MSPNDAALLDVAQALRRARAFIAGYNQARFDADIEKQSAVIYQLMVAGEAIKRLSPEFRAGHPGVPWRKVTGMRDVLIHAYDQIDLEVVWETVVEDVPKFLAVIEPLLPVPGPEGG